MRDYNALVAEFTQKDKDRFWAKVAFSQAGCWRWAGSKSLGYGGFKFGGSMLKAHRIAYILSKALIRPGLTLDHLCRNRACVRPEHLEPITQKENVWRGEGLCGINAQKTHCIRSHEFTEDNIKRRENGGRYCIACRKLYDESRNPHGGLPMKLRTHCPKGHPYNEANTAHYGGSRECRTCHRERAMQTYWEKKQRKEVQHGA